MKKYYIGLIVLAILTLGLTGYAVAQASGSKQDRQTEKRAQEIASSLDAHISRRQSIPTSLDEAGIKDVPSTISYRKISDSEYEVCVDFKTASTFSGVGPDNILSGLIFSRYAGGYEYDTSDYESSYKPSSLYYYGAHKKGKDCQTAQPYLYGSYYDDQSLLKNYPGDDLQPLIGGSDDTERRSDISALHAQVEVFYAMEGRYPTLANLNDAAWRSANMKGLDSGALRDPEGVSMTLASAPAQKVYSYVPTDVNGKTCNNVGVDCVSYTLTATLSTNAGYTKTNLN